MDDGSQTLMLLEQIRCAGQFMFAIGVLLALTYWCDISNRNRW